MTIKSDVKAVVAELSSILAGFKLALILISYFSLGSVAKWIISHWYPFTRWLWDAVCDFFTFPHLPVLVKDSLTALVFFLPLGFSAVISIWKSENQDSQRTHRVVGSVFGAVFLVIICKDVLTSIAESITVDARTVTDTYFSQLISEIAKVAELVDSIGTTAILTGSVIYLISAMSIIQLLRRRLGTDRVNTILQTFSRRFFRFTAAGSTMISILLGAVFGFAVDIGIGEQDTSILIAITIMMVICALIATAALFVPRKLFLTTGAAMAFLLAAVLFEFAVAAIKLIETLPQS